LSSTAIVLKSLYDNHEAETLHGRAATGILIIQDIWALLVLVVLPGMGKGGISLALIAVGKTVLLCAFALLLSRYVLSRIFTRLTRFPEMTVAASIGWCTLCSAIAHHAGLSPSLGALAAGLSIANFPYHVFVRDKIEPLRDLFLLLFFVSLGMKIPLPDASIAASTGIILLFMVASRFLTIYPLVRISGGSARTSFLTSISLTQISEFSIVILGVGAATGVLTEMEIAPILYLMAITAVTSSYIIRYGHSIFFFYHRMTKRKTETGDERSETKNYPIVILGLHRGSQTLIEMIVKRAPDLVPYLLVVDYNAEILAKLKSAGIAGYLGDISRIETLEKAGVSHSQVIVATIPQMLLKGITSERLIGILRQIAPGASIIASADFKNQVSFLKKAGADRVILPYFLAGEQCADLVMGIIGKALPAMGNETL
ncbi:MAG TPA: cation:proton antiporter, partial [Spirochaetota bacterium]